MTIKITDWNKLKKDLFGGSFKQSQVDGLNFKIQAFNEMGVTNIKHAAYMLATSYHETAATMLPITEYGKGKGKAYGTWYKNSIGAEYSWKNGNKNIAYMKNKYPYLYYGRGDVQLTWYDNYEKAGKELKVDLLGNPDKALDPIISAKVMILGMRYGWFTKRNLDRYINEKGCDYVEARRIINGNDKAEQIASYAKKFESILSNS